MKIIKLSFARLGTVRWLEVVLLWGANAGTSKASGVIVRTEDEESLFNRKRINAFEIVSFPRLGQVGNSGVRCEKFKISR